MSGFAFLIELLERGTADERRTALQIIGGILKAQAEIGGTLPPELAQWLGTALVMIAEGDDPKVVLGLNTKRRNTHIRTQVLSDNVREIMRSGSSQEQAIFFVAEHLGVEPEALKTRLTRK